MTALRRVAYDGLKESRSHAQEFLDSPNESQTCLASRRPARPEDNVLITAKTAFPSSLVGWSSDLDSSLMLLK